MSECQTKMPDVCRLIDCLRHRTNDQRLYEGPRPPPSMPMSNGLEIARGYCFRDPNVDPKRMQCRLQLLELLLVRLPVDAIQSRRTLLRQFLGNRNVRHDHALFDHAMSIVATA